MRLCRFSIALLLPLACASAPTPDAGMGSIADARQPRPPGEARALLRTISTRPVQLWVVAHVRAHKTLKQDGSVDVEKLIADALHNADAIVEGGGDAIILINSRCEMPLYEQVIHAVRERHPTFPLGISALSYGPENLTEGYRLAEKFDARIVWMEVVPGTRFEYEEEDGSFTEAEVTPRTLAREVQSKMKPGAMLVAGVHMKYTRPLDGLDFPAAMRDALGWVDGINITGPRTGVRADVERVRRAREVAGDYPLGLASGVSVENVGEVLPFIDYAIVGTSLKDPENALHTSRERVRALRRVMDGEATP